jgi:hypothetical protein
MPEIPVLFSSNIIETDTKFHRESFIYEELWPKRLQSSNSHDSDSLQNVHGVGTMFVQQRHARENFPKTDLNRE